MSDIFVFYAGMLLAEYTHIQYVTGSTGFEWTPETYNGAWMYVRTAHNHRYFISEPGWYRADRTPVLLEDVPKNLRAYALILTN